MLHRRIFTLLAALIFLLLAGLNLWRLLVGFPITIGGYTVGGAASFLMMSAFGALGLMLLLQTRTRNPAE